MGFLTRWLERRSTVRDPAPWLHTALAGTEPTTAGVNVSPDKALTLSAYFAAIRAIAEDVAKLPLILYRHLDPRGKQRMNGHPLYRLLHDSPNDEMSSMSFRETLTLHAIGWGNGLAEIVRNANKQPVALWPLDPARVRIERGPDMRLRYVVYPAGKSETVTLGPMDVFHVHGLGFDGVTGYSVAHLARESIGAALAAEKQGAALFGQGSVPGGTLETDYKLGPEQISNLRSQWEKKYGGLDKAHRLAVLPHGTRYKPIAIPNKDAQWIQAREFSVSELARWLRIPPHKIAHMRDATFSNIESQAREYVVDTLQPWMTRWEQEIARKLIPARSPLFAEHLVDGLLRGDTEGRFKAYRTAILSGWMSRNEARALENLNPAEGLDEFLIPLNTEPVDRAR